MTDIIRELFHEVMEKAEKAGLLVTTGRVTLMQTSASIELTFKKE